MIKLTKKVGLVLEGGAMRGMFTAGVLDVMLDENIKVDGIIGTSAGAVFGCNYFSEQKGRVIRYSKRFCRDLRYMSLLSFILTGNIINKRFAFKTVPNKLDKFDNDTFMKNKKDFYLVATNVETGKAEYIKIEDCNKQIEYFRATSAIPLASKIVKINDKKYLDGGISDSIAFEKFQKLGYDKIIVVLTRPLTYEKKPLSNKVVKMLRKKFKKYPALVETMIKRHENYNETVKKIIKLEKENKIFVIRPSQDINVKVIERNKDNLQKVYELGLKDGKKAVKKLKKYLS